MREVVNDLACSFEVSEDDSSVLSNDLLVRELIEPVAFVERLESPRD